MSPSFFRWALIVIVLAGAAFVLVGTLLDEEPQPDRVRPAPQAAQTGSQPEPQPAQTPVPPRSERVLFAFDSAKLDAGETAKLARFAVRIKERPDAGVVVVGHADRIGSEAYNLALSQRRAKAVAAYLMDRGVAAGALTTDAQGAADPLTGDDCIDLGPETAGNSGLIECLQPDRRVELGVVERR
jgi:OmpA-OmpF porin, OOP family